MEKISTWYRKAVIRPLTGYRDDRYVLKIWRLSTLRWENIQGVFTKESAYEHARTEFGLLDETL